MIRAVAESFRVHLLDHLLDNAMRYNTAAGTISIELSEEGRNAKVVVRDGGVGIPGGEQEKIFEKFFRATNVHALEPGGAGLSLFVARTIIESSGGKMGFESAVGSGSAFWFTIPTVTASPDADTSKNGEEDGESDKGDSAEGEQKTEEKQKDAS